MVPTGSATPSTAAVRCAYCDGPLPVDFLKGAAREGVEPVRYCCYGCRVLGESRPARIPRERPPGDQGAPWFRIGIGVVLASQSMLLSFAVNLTPPEGPIRTALHAALAGSALAVLAILGVPLLQASWSCAWRRQVRVELLFLAGVVGAFGASVWSSLTGIGAVYYEVVAVLLVVYTVGRTLTAHARERAVAETRRLRNTFDTCRRISPGGEIDTCPAAAVEVGDRVQVFAGEPVPVDGVIERGTSFVRETPLTGEPYPVVRRIGDPVLAGSWAEDGELQIRVTVPGRGRRLDTLLSLVEGARGAEDDGTVRLADRITVAFLPIVLLTSVGTFVYWSLQGRWAEGLFNALAVLLVACPCALGLATPLGLWNALATLAARGVLVRSSSSLERLAAVDTVVFDKTGTLSEERQSLIDLAVASGGLDRTSLLALLATVQARSSHPVARAFVAANLGPAGASLEVRSVHLKPVPGAGLEAWVAAGPSEHHLRLGQAGWIGHAKAAPALLAELRAQPGDQLLYVEHNGRLAAVAAVRERLRDSVPQALNLLARLGCSARVLTGDRADRAHQLLVTTEGDKPGVEGSLTPEEKARRVGDLSREGRSVAFVGDGINDAPALKAASVGVALQSGAALASATADVVLCSGDLREVPRAMALARRVRQSLRTNLAFAAFYNGLGMVLAATGHLHPVVAALLMVGSSTIVSWRALRSGRDGCHPDDTLDAPRLWPRILVVGAFAAQVPGLIVWGRLDLGASVLVSVVLAGLAVFAWRGGPSRTPGATDWVPSGVWMALAMLGPGNLGMLLGWWADAGFQPIMQDGVCLCCRSHHYFALTGKIPWMYLGMLAGSLPWMTRGPGVWPGRLGRWTAVGLAAAGMVAGMGWGADLAVSWAGPGHPQQFLWAWSGMTLGMLVGMFFACALGEAIAAARRR